MLAPILVLFLVAALLEYRSLKKLKRYREMISSAILLAAGLTLGILRLLHVEIPSPMNGINTLFQPLSQLLDVWKEASS
ncbi:hypothetical protein [Paenibacillus sp. Soil750]|uniref:hypothetical protein n=1 Tax=Paenibacillus sp. Soil750 TaxID=1736398 RepID=UPI0006FFD919|nr:hypothetical protein [Paenibacillus sp. Soil750]KRE72922.1 hypothetical protein ASL11_07740 [Paenibacillus sp. Soil750]